MGGWSAPPKANARGPSAAGKAASRSPTPSMAQTRAISRALRAPLGQIVVLAGYQPAGVEAMSEEAPKPPERPAEASEAQVAEIAALIRSLGDTRLRGRSAGDRPRHRGRVSLAPT